MLVLVRRRRERRRIVRVRRKHTYVNLLIARLCSGKQGCKLRKTQTELGMFILTKKSHSIDLSHSPILTYITTVSAVADGR